MKEFLENMQKQIQEELNKLNNEAVEKEPERELHNVSEEAFGDSLVEALKKAGFEDVEKLGKGVIGAVISADRGVDIEAVIASVLNRVKREVGKKTPDEKATVNTISLDTLAGMGADEFVKGYAPNTLNTLMVKAGSKRYRVEERSVSKWGVNGSVSVSLVLREINGKGVIRIEM